MRDSIGVPAYNAAHTLGECLKTLREQTLEDLEIVVSDNCSTDETPELLAAAAAEDPRIRVIRQKENIGSLKNFQAVLHAATGPYFMWRADDDLSDLDYAEKLAAALDAAPNAYLAVGRIKRTFYGRATQPDDLLYPKPAGRERIDRILAALRGFHPSCFYGLWRRERIVAIRERVLKAFPHTWAHDQITVAPAILDEAVTADDATAFHQRVGLARGGFNYQTGHTVGQRLRLRGASRPDFVAAFRAEILARDFSAAERRVLLAEVDAFATARIAASKLDILRWRVKRAVLGENAR